MDFDFPISDVLPDEITCIDGNLVPEGFEATEECSYGDCQKYISIILNKIGEASAIAQGLNIAVTSSDRLQHSDHRVYLLKNSNGPNGQVVGLLKVGPKKLFVFDQAGGHHEMQPLCVLDFYVHESKQRNGCGKYLYDHMLQAESVQPGHLALDRPSEKLIHFLAKHFQLEHFIPQSNNFVVYDSFFDSRSEGSKRAGSCSGRAAAAGCGTRYRDTQIQSSRRAAVSNRPHSSISKIMDANAAYSLTNGSGEVTDYPPVATPHQEVRTSPTKSCSSDVDSSEESHVHRDIKFQHQRLW